MTISSPSCIDNSSYLKAYLNPGNSWFKYYSWFPTYLLWEKKIKNKKNQSWDLSYIMFFKNTSYIVSSRNFLQWDSDKHPWNTSFFSNNWSTFLTVLLWQHLLRKANCYSTIPLTWAVAPWYLPSNIWNFSVLLLKDLRIFITVTGCHGI